VKHSSTEYLAYQWASVGIRKKDKRSLMLKKYSSTHIEGLNKIKIESKEKSSLILGQKWLITLSSMSLMRGG
jgi:hypothetical protein